MAVGNKNSQYISSLVDFLLDTKPYHSKLTEIAEEYHFNDDMHVHIVEHLRSRIKISSTWTSNYFSGGNSLLRTVPLSRVVSPAFSYDTNIAGQGENKDLALVPYTYSKKSFDNVGVNAVYVRRAEGNTEALTESIDYFQSHGSFQFQIKQTINANGKYDPLWAETRDDNVVEYSMQRTRQLALDIGNVENEYIRVSNLVNAPTMDFQEWTLTSIDDASPLWSVSGAASGIIGTVMSGDTFTHELVTFDTHDLGGVPPLDTQLLLINPTRAINQVRTLLNEIQDAINDPARTYRMTPAELWDANNDIQRELDSLFAILDVPNLPRRYDTLLTYVSIANPQVVFTQRINTQNGIPFTMDVEKLEQEFARLSSPLFFGAFTDRSPDMRESGRPGQRIVIAADAPLETWNIIKVNPLAHSRPIFNSPHYGYITDIDDRIGLITIIDAFLPTGEYVLKAQTSGRFFNLTSSVDPGYTGIAEVGVPYNDGRIAFTIKGGNLAKFTHGDSFYISVENLPVRAKDLDFGYGYDLDPYDDNAYTTPIFFGYDGRFTNYNFAAFNLQISEDAINGRRFRIRAKVPPGAPVIAGAADGVELPALPGPPTDLLFYNTDEFSVEYSDDDFNTLHTIGNVNTGEYFESVIHGINFTLVPADGPFIAASSNDTNGRVEGGDVISFTVYNPLPTFSIAPFTSANQPRLIMHSDGFYDAVAADWILYFKSPHEYTLTSYNKASGRKDVAKTCRIPTTGQILLEGLSFKGNGIHYTIVPTRGFSAGDTFKFETYERKPSYLVHGSVSGFTGDVAYGEHFDNGKIAFKIEKPQNNLYINDNVVANIPGLFFTLREDCPSITYLFTPSEGGYLINRSDIGVTAFTKTPGNFSDQYITGRLTREVSGVFKIDVNANNFTLWNGQDVVFLKPEQTAYLPKSGEHVIIEKTKNGHFGLAITPSTTNISTLSPITIDERFIDRNTNQIITLETTSPETSLLRGWIPLIFNKRDSTTSIAEFSDPATLYDVRSAATGKIVGNIKQKDLTNTNEPIVFEWDLDFFNTYLLLNDEANLVTMGTGWNDKIRAKISESVKFIIDGGDIAEDWVMHDEVNVNIEYKNLFQVKSHAQDEFSAIIQDGPFAQFLPGYANTPYDNEIEGYDTGSPLTEHYNEALALSALSPLSRAQRLRLDDLIDLIAPLLNNNKLSETTLAQFLENMDNAVNTSYIHDEPLLSETGFSLLTENDDTLIINDVISTSDFGYPVRGMALDINSAPSGAAAASIQETATMVCTDAPNSLDENGFDLYGMDVPLDVIAMIYSGALPPIPNDPQPGVPYAMFNTPLTITKPSRVFDITFTGTPAQLSILSPTFSIWLPNAPAPWRVPIVEHVSLGKFRFSVPYATEAKIIVG